MPGVGEAVIAVADTNVVVSGLLWPGASASVLDAAVSRGFQLVTTDELLAELEEVLSRPHLEPRLRARGRTVAEVVSRYRAVSTLVSPADLEPPAELRDLEDLPVLRCAVAAKAQAIVTGDKDLLVLKEFEGIQMLTPRMFVSALGV